LKQITIKQLRQLRSATIRDSIPFELVSDGEVLGVLIAHDVPLANKVSTKTSHDVPLADLPLSKKKQAAGMTAQFANYVPY